MSEDRGYRFIVVIFLIAVVLSILGIWYDVVNAQDLPASTVTTFSPHCYTVTNDTLTAYFGYVSNGTEHWIGSGYDVTTQAGNYPDVLSVTVDLLPAPDLPDVTLGRYVEYQDAAMAAFNGIDATQTIHFDLSAMPLCGEIAAPLQQDTCPAWAINGATGDKFCMWSLKRVGEYQ